VGLRKRAARIALVSVALFAGAAGVAYGTQALTQTSTATSQIFACQLNNVGTIRIVAAGVACTKYETLISWNVQGAKGEAGPAGPVGPAGTPGAPGAGVSVALLAASDPNCLFGGSRFTAFDGVSYACNGSPGAAGTPGSNGAPGADGVDGTPGADGTDGISVTSTIEPNGENCQFGGVKLVSASGSTYVCNGAPGPQGQTGATGPAGPAGSGDGFVGSACSIPPYGTAGTVATSVAADGTITFRCEANTPSLCPSPLPIVANGTVTCDPAVGTVVITCAVGFTKTPSNTCVNTSTDPANCGALGVSIPSNGTNHATYACIAGTATVVACTPGFFDANHVFGDGCEVQDDGSSSSAAAPTELGFLASGQTVSRSGVTDPTDDWYAFTCAVATSCNITSATAAFQVFDAPGGSMLGHGPGTYATPLGSVLDGSIRYWIRIPASSSFTSYTLTISN
jgi:hypothetical protein